MIKTTFRNTEMLDQVDWEREIACDPEADTDEVQAMRTSDAAMAWAMAKHQMDESVRNATEPHVKSNLMRVLQYFYARFIYEHGLFYEKDCDAYDERLWSMEEHPIESLRKRLGSNLERSHLPLEQIRDMESALTGIVREERAEREKLDGGYEQVRSLLEAHGIRVEKPKGLRKEGDRDTVCTVHDGVRYHISMMKERRHRDRQVGDVQARAQQLWRRRRPHRRGHRAR